MFFGGGFPTGDVRRRRTHFYQHSGDENRPEVSAFGLILTILASPFQNTFGVLLQLMPILILVFLSIASQFLVSDPPFSLHRTK